MIIGHYKYEGLLYRISLDIDGDYIVETYIKDRWGCKTNSRSLCYFENIIRQGKKVPKCDVFLEVM